MIDFNSILACKIQCLSGVCSVYVRLFHVISRLVHMKNHLNGLVFMMDATCVRYEMLYLSDRCSGFE